MLIKHKTCNFNHFVFQIDDSYDDRLIKKMENIPKLQTGLDFSIFKERATNEFKRIASIFPAPRYLAFPDYLSMYISSLLNPTVVSPLVKRTVRLSGISEMQSKHTLIVISPPDSENINKVCQTFKRVPNFSKVLLVIPRSTDFTDNILTDNEFSVMKGIIPTLSDEIAVYDFDANILPIDNDFFLLPCYNSYLNMSIYYNYDDIYNSAHALKEIENVFGEIPQVFCLGELAERVYSTLQQMRNHDSKHKSLGVSQVTSMIIIDRNADLITPVTSQVSIEGIIDQIFGIDYGHCQFVQPNDKEMVILDFMESFDVLRAVRTLSSDKGREKMRTIEETLMNIKKALEQKDKNIKEFSDLYMKGSKILSNYSKLQLLFKCFLEALTQRNKKYPTIYSTINAEFNVLRDNVKLMDYAENLVLLMNDWKTALRLIALESASGISHSSKLVKRIQSEIVAEFGFDAQESIMNLEKTKYLSTKPVKMPKKGCLDSLNLFSEEFNGEPIEVAATALGGFVPPSVRIVQKITNGEWPTIYKAFQEKCFMSVNGDPPKQLENDVNRVIVFFVGGVTLTEVATIRNIGRSYYKGEIEFIIGSTEKINCETFMDQLCPILKK